jgi:hypothetical protein
MAELGSESLEPYAPGLLLTLTLVPHYPVSSFLILPGKLSTVKVNQLMTTCVPLQLLEDNKQPLVLVCLNHICPTTTMEQQFGLISTSFLTTKWSSLDDNRYYFYNEVQMKQALIQ